MEIIKGEQLDKFPIKDLVKASDLIYFDGPLLSHFIDRKARNFLYYWCDCNTEVNRWLIFPVLDLDLQDYLQGKRSLYDLIINSQSFSKVFVADIDDNVEFQSVWEVLVSDLPDSYIPEKDSFYEFTPKSRNVDFDEAFYDVTYRHTYSKYEESEDESYKISLDKRWSFIELADLPLAYNKAYAFIYSLEGDEYLFSRQYKSQPWRGGYSSYNFYQGIQDKIPIKHRPEILSIHYSSPGAIELKLLLPVAFEIRELVESVVQNERELKNLYTETYEQLNRRNLLRKNLSPYQEFEEDNLIFIKKSADRMILLLNAKYLEKIETLTDDPLITLKILLSFYRIIRDLAKFQISGKALF